jgi:hypothetical protein
MWIVLVAAIVIPPLAGILMFGLRLNGVASEEVGPYVGL